MGKLRANRAIGTLQGAVAGLVYVQRADGVVVVREMAETGPQPTPRRLANRERFARAALYLERVKSDPDQYGPYKVRAQIVHRRACNLVIAGFLNPPTIEDVDLSAYTGQAGQLIVVQATLSKSCLGRGQHNTQVSSCWTPKRL